MDASRLTAAIIFLYLVLLVPILWQTYAYDSKLMFDNFQVHPLREDLEYQPIVFISTLFDRCKPLLYLVSIMLFPPLARSGLLKIFLLYEFLLIIDFILTYDQFPFRRYVIVILGIYTFIYYILSIKKQVWENEV